MATTSYRPSNGIEGARFTSRFCDRCVNDANDDCEIRTNSMVFPADDPNYPPEWVIEDGKPKCTAWMKA